MKDKIAKKILKMEKDKLMSKPESERDWELITALDIAIKALEERPTGEWKYNGFCVTTTQYKCSECGMYSLDRSKYCPNCGADMRVKGD